MESFHRTKGSHEEENGSFKNWSLKGSLGNQKRSLYGIAAEASFRNLYV